MIRAWDLELLWCLVLGDWNFRARGPLHSPIPFRAPRRKPKTRSENENENGRANSSVKKKVKVPGRRRGDDEAGEIWTKKARNPKRAPQSAIADHPCKLQAENSTKPCQKIFQPLRGLATPLRTWKTFLPAASRNYRNDCHAFVDRSTNCFTIVHNWPNYCQTSHEQTQTQSAPASACRLLPTASPSLRSAHNARGGTLRPPVRIETLADSSAHCSSDVWPVKVKPDRNVSTHSARP